MSAQRCAYFQMTAWLTRVVLSESDLTTEVDDLAINSDDLKAED